MIFGLSCGEKGLRLDTSGSLSILLRIAWIQNSGWFRSTTEGFPVWRFQPHGPSTRTRGAGRHQRAQTVARLACGHTRIYGGTVPRKIYNFGETWLRLAREMGIVPSDQKPLGAWIPVH